MDRPDMWTLWHGETSMPETTGDALKTNEVEDQG